MHKSNVTWGAFADIPAKVQGSHLRGVPNYAGESPAATRIPPAVAAALEVEQDRHAAAHMGGSTRDGDIAPVAMDPVVFRRVLIFTVLGGFLAVAVYSRFQ